MADTDTAPKKPQSAFEKFVSMIARVPKAEADEIVRKERVDAEKRDKRGA